MTNVYKINLFNYDMSDVDKNENHDKEHYKNYCIKEKKLGWGWTRKNPKPVFTLDDYHKDYGSSRSLSVACNQIKDMKENDYCWTYVDGTWYLGKVKGDFHFGIPDELHPAFGMYRDCEWKPISDKDTVPGSISTYSRKDATVRYISNDSSFIKYCEYLYGGQEKPFGLNFLNLVHYDDLEDLVGLYLQKHGYYIFPSTNKQGTKDYEFKLIRTDGKKEAIIQCKSNEDIPWESLGGYTKEDIYVLSVKETKNAGNSRTMLSKEKCSENWDMGWKSKDERIKMFDALKLEEWARNNQTILPKRIQNFLKLSEKNK